MIRSIVVTICIVCIVDLSFSKDQIEFPERYKIRTPLPQLADEISTQNVYRSKDTLNSISRQQRHSVQPISQFEPLPQQNPWVVLGVIAAFVLVILVAGIGFGGS